MELNKEGSDVSVDEIVIELPLVAGNLSPRFVVMLEENLDNSLMGLNINSVGGNAKNGRKARGKGLRAQLQADRQFRSTTSLNNSFQVLRYD